MRTIDRATAILTAAPREALRDAIGLAAMAFLIFGGFLVPAFI